jgi:hypothetical protein
MRRSWIPIAIALFAFGAAALFFASPAARLRVASAVIGASGGAVDRNHVAAEPGGSFDPTMSGVCQSTCSEQEPYKVGDIVAQPGVLAGDLTRCPVSGVVFRVDAERPRRTIASHEYVVCCEGCAEKLAQSPELFVRL